MKQKVHLLIILQFKSSLPSCKAADNRETPSPIPWIIAWLEEVTLGDMGEPVSYVHNGQEFKFCCKPCIPKFKKNPEKFIQELKEESKGL